MAVHSVPLGGFFDDIVNAITHPADDASKAWTIATHPADDATAIVSVRADDFVDALQSAPGGEFLSPPVRAFVDGPLRDFAKSDAGAFLLGVAATSEYYALVPYLGPQLAAVAFATPGFFAGDDFGNAWISAFVDRVEQTAKILSAGNLDFNVLPPDVQQKITDLGGKLTAQLASADGYLKTLGLPTLSQLTYDALSKQLNIRLDAATAALVKARNNLAELAAWKRMNFDPLTGALLPPGVSSTIAGAAQNLVALRPVYAGTATSASSKASLASSTVAFVAGKAIPVVPRPAPTHPAAAVEQAVGAVRATTPTSSAPIVVALVGVVAVGGLALWWFKFRKGRR